MLLGKWTVNKRVIHSENPQKGTIEVNALADSIRKNAAKRDSAGTVCNSGMGMLFF